VRCSAKGKLGKDNLVCSITADYVLYRGSLWSGAALRRRGEALISMSCGEESRPSVIQLNKDPMSL